MTWLEWRKLSNVTDDNVTWLVVQELTGHDVLVAECGFEQFADAIITEHNKIRGDCEHVWMETFFDELRLTTQTDRAWCKHCGAFMVQGKVYVPSPPARRERGGE